MKINIQKITKKMGIALVLTSALAIQSAAAQDRHDNNRGDAHPQNRPANTGHISQHNGQQHRVTARPAGQRPVIRNTTVNRRPVTVRNNTTVVNNARVVRRPVTVGRPGYRPTGWATTRRAYTRPPVVYGGRRYYAYHTYYAHPYTPYYYGPRWHPIGFFLSSLINTAIIVNYDNRAYRYDDGVFYEPYNNGYQVVAAPPGAYIPSLPAGYEQVMVGGQTYYYFGGAFFILSGSSYQVVQSPAGAVIHNLPDGATSETIDNYSYVQYNGTYYQPIQINGQNAYEVVEMEQDTTQP